MAPIWLELLDETARACAEHGRDDLIRGLQLRRAQLLDPRLRVLVIGEPGQGKSQLINALLNAPVCPVGSGVSTGLPTVVQHAEVPCATMVATAAAGLPMSGEQARISRTPLPFDQLPKWVASRADSRAAGAGHVEVGIPRALLAAGLVLIDTPGTDGTDPARAANPLGPRTRADAVLLVSDATCELSASELNLLLHVSQAHPRVVVVQTKIDLVPRWREVVERNRQLLADAGVPALVIPVSAALRLAAARANDKQINAESRFPELVARLQRDLTSKSDVLAHATVGLVTRTVLEQLAAPLRAELDVQTSGSASDALSRFQRVQREVDELRRCTARWQNTLADEMADLVSDIEYDLRDRTRTILRQVDEAFDTADPLAGWDAFQEWLERSLTEAAETNFSWLAERCGWITRLIADQFSRYGYDVFPDWSVAVPDDLPDRIPAMDRPNVERLTRTQMLFAGLRGSYGGLLMFGLATTLAGLPLLNPISIGAGALFGGRSIQDEGKSVLKRRQSAVKAATQRYVDDFFIRLSKESRDCVRQVQRMLRDHFNGVTEDLQEAIARSFRDAKQDADVDAARRDQRRREIEQKMRRLAAIYERARELTSGRSGTPAELGVGA